MYNRVVFGYLHIKPKPLPNSNRFRNLNPNSVKKFQTLAIRVGSDRKTLKTLRLDEASLKRL
jgi:hypothetical protein